MACWWVSIYVFVWLSGVVLGRVSLGGGSVLFRMVSVLFSWMRRGRKVVIM